jgi:hypothetical protein
LRWRTWMSKDLLLERRLRSQSHSYFTAYITPDNTIDFLIYNCANNATLQVFRSDGDGYRRRGKKSEDLCPKRWNDLDKFNVTCCILRVTKRVRKMTLSYL